MGRRQASWNARSLKRRQFLENQLRRALAQKSAEWAVNAVRWGVAEKASGYSCPAAPTGPPSSYQTRVPVLTWTRQVLERVKTMNKKAQTAFLRSVFCHFASELDRPPSCTLLIIGTLRG